ncbi:MAG: amidohydrolase [Anaerolineae bacterium]|nr:amidohydrolase [Anaerolineae bacterium]
MIIDCEAYHVTEPLGGKVFGLSGLEHITREAGIDKAVVVAEIGVRPRNRQLAEELATCPPLRDLFIGCAWINPQFGEESVRELEMAVKEWGFCALKLMPTHHAFRPVTKAAHALMRKAEELNIPVTIHSGSTSFSHPLEIAELAAAFPKVPVVMDHMGYRYFVNEAIAGARRVPNLYLATTAVMEPHFIRMAVKELGAEKVLFGTNAPHVYPSTQLLVVRQAELSEADEKKVLAENAARIFRLN